jgi:hypothetical protein
VPYTDFIGHFDDVNPSLNGGFRAYSFLYLGDKIIVPTFVNSSARTFLTDLDKLDRRSLAKLDRLI